MNPDLARLLASLGYGAQPDATMVNNMPRFPAQRSIGPATRGNRPLPQATVQSQYRPRYDKAMSILSDMLPVLGEIRGVQGGLETARQGSPVIGGLLAAAGMLPMGGRIGKAAEKDAVRLAETYYNPEGRRTIIVRSAQEPGKYQASFFHDAEATRPWMHVTGDSFDALRNRVAEDGYTLPAHPPAPSDPRAFRRLQNRLSDLEDAMQNGDDWSPKDEAARQAVIAKMHALVKP